MAGIKEIGVHLPYYRLSRKAIGEAWSARGGAGFRRVANFDEDSFTMAIEAGFKCLKDNSRERINGLFFASTTSPYWEKQCAGAAAGVLDLGPEIRTCDFGGSPRSSTNAFLCAADASRAGLGDVLVISGDCRPATPRSPLEGAFGDAGAAMVVGESDTICDIVDTYTIWNDIIDIWRRDKDQYVKTWEDRYIIQMGYEKDIERSVKGILEKNGLTPENIDRLVLFGPDSRTHGRMVKRLGFKPEQAQNPLVDDIGNTGSPHAFIMLASCLKEAKAGQKILWVNFGSGSDAILLEVKNGVESKRDALANMLVLDKGEELTYQKYLAFRNFVETPQELVRMFPSASVMWRTRKWAASLHGSRCKTCGTIAFPVQRVCYQCRSKDNFEEVRLSERKGKVFTFSLDNLAGGPNPPTIQTLVETEGGARIYCLMTDCNPHEIKIGTEVEMTYRLFHEEGGFYNYYWKCRPI